MGWLTYHREKGESNLDHFNAKTGDAGRFIDMATVGNRVIYGAYERASDGLVEGAVILIQWVPNDHMNFGYKDMTESMGPCEDECPERILKLLSPLEDLDYGSQSTEWARAWRERCWARVEAAKAKPKVRAGDTIRFKHPITFANGSVIETLKLVKDATFSDGYSRYRLPRNWRRSFDYEVVT